MERFKDKSDAVPSVLEQLFLAFDRDCDGVISSNDFVDTIKGLDSETMLKMRVRQSKKHMKQKLCTDMPALYRLKTSREKEQPLSSTNSFIVYP